MTRSTHRTPSQMICTNCNEHVCPERFPGRGLVCPDCLTASLTPIPPRKEKNDLKTPAQLDRLPAYRRAEIELAQTDQFFGLQF